METKNSVKFASQACQEFQKIGIEVSVKDVKAVIIGCDILFITYCHPGLNPHHVAMIDALVPDHKGARIGDIGRYIELSSSIHGISFGTEMRYEPVRGGEDYELLSEEIYRARKREARRNLYAQK